MCLSILTLSIKNKLKNRPLVIFKLLPLIKKGVVGLYHKNIIKTKNFKYNVDNYI